jgi:5-methylthioribose kinase
MSPSHRAILMVLLGGVSLNRLEVMAKHAKFPWLSDRNSSVTEEFLRGRGWILPGESILDVTKAGEGNMNLTLRVITSSRRFILKQARPWVEKYDHIAAPWERMQFECQFYERVSSIPGVGDRMPRLLAQDLSASIILLEDLAPARDMTDMYHDHAISRENLESLASYLSSLHRATRGTELDDFINSAMRRLNHEHIFIVPLAGWEGRDLDKLEPGLSEASEELRRDTSALQAIRELGSIYLQAGAVLCHGDFYPGSWLQTDRGLRVIDAEFSHAGQAEHDVGVALAHLFLAGCRMEDLAHLVECYRREGGDIRRDLLAEFTSIEIIRRILGVAQLPIPVSDGFRKRALTQAIRCLKSKSWESLA